MPLLAFLFNAVLIKNKLNNVKAGAITFLALFVSFILVVFCAIEVHKNGPIQVELWNWISYKAINFNIKFSMDQLSVILSLMVTGIGSAIAFFSIGYMDHEEKVGWEGVGLSSYLLIGFWYQELKNVNAAKKAFLANRVGDFGVVLGMIGYALVFNTISFTELKNPDLAIIAQNKEMLIGSSLLLVLGVTGKSAQIPLFIWLPDAMMGPTPVSALMHAATMVTAGIFLLCRVSNVIIHFPVVLDVIAWVGAITSLLAALIAITQTDIKKILAYSTVSQLGYMVMACGLGAFSTGLFHVFTHAFFKALLFLCAASVIYGCHHEQDIFKMGDLKKKMPITFWTFLVGLLAIAGIPGFSGFFSKDEILSMAYTNPGNGIYLYAVGFVSALLTAFYMTRMLLLVFIVPKKKDKDHHHEAHESPLVMTAPLVLLAICSAIAGYVGLPHIFGGHHNSRIFQEFVDGFTAKPIGHFELSHDAEILMMSVTTLMILASMSLAYYIYVVRQKDNLKESLKNKFLTPWKISSSKFKVDEFYELIFIRPLYKFGGFLVDIVETHIINGVVKLFSWVSIESGNFIDENKPDRIDLGILYMVIGLTILITAIFNVFKF
jgi:NADH-quinone oxidoreductase subunit L